VSSEGKDIMLKAKKTSISRLLMNSLLLKKPALKVSQLFHWNVFLLHFGFEKLMEFQLKE